MQLVQVYSSYLTVCLSVGAPGAGCHARSRPAALGHGGVGPGRLLQGDREDSMSVMTQTFVRYSPDVERADPDFEQTLQTVIENMKRHIEASFKVEGIGRVVRDAHAKGYGLARGEVEILNGLPAAYAQGIYARPGRHEAMVRFSQGTSHTGADRFL